MAQSVLVIDNDQIILYGIELVLQEEGYEILTAPSALNGLEQARSHRPDVIVSDFAMPEIDGLDLLKRLRNDPTTADIPFVLMSAYMTPDLKARCLRAGARVILVKPFDSERLIRVIREVLASS